MENISKMTTDDSTSMYFSFNSTSACKTMESVTDNSCRSIEYEGNCSQNSTLEAHETNHTVEKMQTVKKLSFGVSPTMGTISRLKSYNALSSTPTSVQLHRSVNVNRGSAAVGDVCDLGLAFLETLPETINADLAKDKENLPPDSEEVDYSEKSSDKVFSEVEKSGKKTVSYLPILKNSHLRGTPNVRRSIPRCEPDNSSEAPPESIQAALQKDKDNLPQDSEEVDYSETSPDKDFSGIQTTLTIQNPNIRGNERGFIPNCEPDLASDAPPNSIHSALPKQKENLPEESEEVSCSETSSVNVFSEIEKTGNNTIRKVISSNFTDLEIPRRTLTVRRSIAKCEPDLASNRPSRIIARKTISSIVKAPNQLTEFPSEDIPQMLNSMLKISKGESLNRKSISYSKNPFNLLGNATRMSIVKTTLNSPARKVSLKCLTSVHGGRNPVRQSVLPINKRKSIAPQYDSVSALRRSALLPNNRKSMIKTTTAPRRSVLPVTKNMAKTSLTSPKKKKISLNSRMTMMQQPSATSMIPTSTTRMVSNPSGFDTEPLNIQNKLTKMKLQNVLKEDFLCEVCSKRFRVFSLFEAHKRSHNVVPSTSKKQTFYSGNDIQCQYCDRKFAIAKALENHIIQNCTKIPPEDRKKFVASDQPSQSKMPMSNFSKSASRNANKIPPRRSQLNSKDAHFSTMARPTSFNKLKKELAHSGVYCTPKKQIACHICKTHFNNILAFTEHKLTHHTHSNAASKNKNGAALPTSSQTQIDVKADGGEVEQEMLEDDIIP